MTISAISSEVGIATSTMMVARRLWRKKNSTRPVMMAASPSSSCTPSTDLRTPWLRSIAVSSEKPAGQLARICSASGSSVSTVWTMLALDCL